MTNDCGAPDGLHQLSARDHLAAIDRERAQQKILAAGDVDLNPIAEEAARSGVETKGAEAKLVGRGDTSAAGRGADTRKQLREGERLGEVVVRAGIQSADHLVLLIERREHDDGRAVGARAQMLRDGVSAAAWKADVEHNGVEVLRVYKLLALLGRGGRDDGVAVFP